MSLSWIYLFVAGLFECGWAIGLKYTEGFTKVMPSVLTLISMFISVWLLSLSMKNIPIGTAYAVWTGIGAVGVSVLGIILFDEPKDIARIFSLTLILVGIVGLKMVSK